MGNKRVVLVTGASSGIGFSTAKIFSEKGYTVYGTSRKVKGFDNKSSSSMPFSMIPMDITNIESITQAINYIIKEEGRIDILVNNAGLGIAGSIEETSLQEAKIQIDTNFVGTFSVIKSVLPIMREQKYGRIINVSSVAGLLSLPFQSFYSCSKYSLEALTEALRIEVRPFGIQASLVEPGDTKTGFTKSRIFSDSSNNELSPYYKRFRRSIERMEKDEQNGVSPDKVARCIYNVSCKKSLPIRTVVGLDYKIIAVLKKLIPNIIAEKLIALLYG